MKPDYTLPPEKYNGMLALFEYYTDGRIIPAILESPEDIKKEEIERSRVIVLWNRLAYPENPLPQLAKEASSVNSSLQQFDSGQRLTKITFRK